jgi:hypothetical protein
VAIKVIHSHFLESTGFFKRFLREAAAATTVEQTERQDGEQDAAAGDPDHVVHGSRSGAGIKVASPAGRQETDSGPVGSRFELPLPETLHLTKDAGVFLVPGNVDCLLDAEEAVETDPVRRSPTVGVVHAGRPRLLERHGPQTLEQVDAVGRNADLRDLGPVIEGQEDRTPELGQGSVRPIEVRAGRFEPEVRAGESGRVRGVLVWLSRPGC